MCDLLYVQPRCNTFSIVYRTCVQTHMAHCQYKWRLIIRRAWKIYFHQVNSRDGWHVGSMLMLARNIYIKIIVESQYSEADEDSKTSNMHTKKSSECSYRVTLRANPCGHGHKATSYASVSDDQACGSSKMDANEALLRCARSFAKRP